MAAPIALPSDVVEFLRKLFSAAGSRAATRLERMPTTHEEALDLAIIDALLSSQGPTILPSQTVVDVDAHFVGGGRHMGRWEIADIGLIIVFRRANQWLRTKVVLLQSKRVYPREIDFVESPPLARYGGFGSLEAPSFPATLGSRTFRFDDSCRYKALQVGDEQWLAIHQYEQLYSIPVHYLLYHPTHLPTDRAIPVVAEPKISTEGQLVGTRVATSASLRTATSNFVKNQAPSYKDLLGSNSSLGWPLGDFIADEVLGCREGYIATDRGDSGLNRVFNQRSAPIAAAIRIAVDLPETINSN